MILKIGILQTELIWEHPETNLYNIEEQIINSNLSCDLLVLPEMFNTGFSMDSSFAEQMDGATINKMKQWANKLNCVVCGSVMIKEEGKFYNRFLWVDHFGDVSFYNKRHLFTMAKEHLTFSPGDEAKVFQLKEWKIFPQVCYDLRFPVWSRNSYKNNELSYDVLIYVANWPHKRSFAWKSLLIARAIENQAYVVGVNRIGEDGNGISYSGDSAVLDFLGKQISMLKPNENGVEIIELNKSNLIEYRNAFPAFKDADKFNLVQR